MDHFLKVIHGLKLSANSDKFNLALCLFESLELAQKEAQSSNITLSAEILDFNQLDFLHKVVGNKAWISNMFNNFLSFVLKVSSPDNHLKVKI